jgi:Na+/H+-dicarboxylate symporter
MDPSAPALVIEGEIRTDVLEELKGEHPIIDKLLEKDDKERLHKFFSSLYSAVMKITQVIVNFIPVAVFAFVYLFVKDLRSGASMEGLGFYLGTVLSANLLHGLVVLPLFLKLFGLSPLRLFKGMMPALSLAFFTKSSCCTMPTAIQCAEERVGISSRVARFAFPLCTTINMNACAAFILITTLFVSQSNGVAFSILDMFVWVFIATIAAVGNAGVPMGCYFLTSALLATMDVPLGLMGVILPFYALIDMLETSINIWSDSCVAAIVHAKEGATTVAPVVQTTGATVVLETPLTS